ncbi:C2H2 type zinc-finger-domain-containing protein [Pelagophyceae sp. CCMP2097]|nr:C2H2 type zinc-finger-domain-containing protein [Pelagophyceae sp. CCMP2097]
MPHCQKEKHNHAPKKRNKEEEKKKKEAKAASSRGRGACAEAPTDAEEAPAVEEVADAFPPDDRDDRDDRPAKKELFVCKYTKKRFKSRATYENHLKSKKYRQLLEAELAAGGGGDDAGDAGDGADAARAADGVDAARAAVDAGDAGDDAACTGATDDAGEAADGADGADGAARESRQAGYSEEEDEWEDMETPWSPVLRESLFDDHEAKSYAANLEYMEKEMGFRLPYRGQPCLVDEEGLFSYLQEKLCRFHACLCCRMLFSSREATLQHMDDKGHRKVNFDADRGALELAPFYDFDATADGVSTAHPCRKNYTGCEFVGSDLVLANGSRLGTRQFKMYYKQRYRPEETRVSVRANLRVAAEKRRNQLEAHFGGQERGMKRHGLLVAGMAASNGNSKALAAQFAYKQDHANNTRMRAIVHHWGAGGGGSHYNMAGCKKVLKGQKSKGLVSRHSKQAAVRNGKTGGNGAKKSSSTAVLM